ncbi:hypothetical protein LTR37_003032 [Vermiconidia calcicola]|uniref:Uncharacterized protein n=1 Tax=Vermiconidia calcicola TaxID=1690605 RepID=A0ACC3NR61_9PEZI|nr:hypothetical protein LTR37_003032 [Vermiconidia calcicola]
MPTITNAMGVTSYSWGPMLEDEALACWFYGIAFSIALSVYQLFELFFGATAEKIVPKEKPAPEEKPAVSQNEKQSAVKKAEEDRKKASSIVYTQLTIDCCDLLIPGAAIGWIPVPEVTPSLRLREELLLASEKEGDMSCEVASSPFPDNIFDEDWKNCGGDSMELEAIVAFNAGVNSNDSNSGGIDPQLLSSVSSPAQSIETAFNDNGTNPDQNLAQDDLSLFDSYPAPPDGAQQASAATPYFHRSIEQPYSLMQPPMYTPSPLRNQFQHRRSVSEPPAGFPDHVHLSQQPPQSQITFTRSGTPLGTPRLPNGTPISRTMSKQRYLNRQQPYPVTKRLPQQGRYQLRRTQTQPVRPDNAPTSTPMMQHISSPPPPPPPHQHMMMMQQSVSSPPQFVSTRVCTPAPSPQQTNIDPRLATPEKKAAVAIPVTVEELRAMITEAVQKAFQESVAVRDTAAAGEEDVGDEIRVGVMKVDSD